MDTMRPSDRLIPWYIAVFFVAFTGLLVWFAWFSIQGYQGVITKDAYKKGLAYNTVIEKAERQESLGWEGAIAFSSIQGLRGTITFTLKDRAGAPIHGAQVKARFIRPTLAGYDTDIILSESASGVYEGEVTLAWPGVWNAHISASHNGQNFQQAKTVGLQ